ncbi:hypothetical protein AMTR_s00040p00212480 [Amborella trichopoda]|uniref:Anaphase-promoting complex subunit 5 n=1 Tax=Amborella trichopoda TaxID=13333 RepID=W1PT55_AMBTC|nr:hypothetical protein AMTR_s00040p00212480 [Amborella trichopoda]
MHSHFGHPNQAIDALTEAIWISQQNHDDPCLVYSMVVVCDLLVYKGVSTTTGMMGSTYSPGDDICRGSSLSAQQQLLVLLKKFLKSAESLKPTRLVAFYRLALVKFDLKLVKRSLVSFSPNHLSI